MTIHTEDKAQFLAGIVSALRENPEWTGEAFQAVAAGADAAMSEMHRRLFSKDAGMLAALALVQSHRVTDDMRGTLNRVLCEALDGDSVLEEKARMKP